MISRIVESDFDLMTNKMLDNFWIFKYESDPTLLKTGFDMIIAVMRLICYTISMYARSWLIFGGFASE
jgi:hypothetical protein